MPDTRYQIPDSRPTHPLTSKWVSLRFCRIRHPASGIRHPASGIRHPASGIRHRAGGSPAARQQPAGAGARGALFALDGQTSLSGEFGHGTGDEGRVVGPFDPLDETHIPTARTGVVEDKHVPASETARLAEGEAAHLWRHAVKGPPGVAAAPVSVGVPRSRSPPPGGRARQTPLPKCRFRLRDRGP